MSKQNTITINGVTYDAHTGMRLGASSVKPAAPAAPKVHKRLERSHTLSRSVVSSPIKKKTASAEVTRPHVVKSPHITKFAPKVSVPPRSGRVLSDIGPITHPIIAKKATELRRPAAKHVAAASPATPAPAHEIKKRAIATALEAAKPAPKKIKRQSFIKKHPRVLSVATASLAVLLLAGYLSYINLPNLSVRLAAAQAGIAASYPSYRPAGYSLSGPVAYSTGQVSMKFAANAGPQNFTLRQTKSAWDSSAVLDNYVNPQSNGDYATYSTNGLTIYTYGDNAAWVNGGILYTVTGNVELSNEQISAIATNM